MPHRLPLRSLACWVFALAAVIPALAQQKHEKVKMVSNLDGGAFLDGEGEIPGGACFRVKGRLTSPDFFDNLKREDTTSGTLFRRGNDILTEFPKDLQLTIVIYDAPCDLTLKQLGARKYLTEDMIRTLRLSLFWKHELDMRPARGIAVEDFERSELAPLIPTAPQPAAQSTAQPLSDPLPHRYEWLLKFDVPAGGVPLTDSLVLMVRTPDHHIVARTAARL
jgi:hypothetical protein